MATIYTQVDSNIRKTWLLMSLFLVMIVGLGYLFGYIYNDANIVIIAVVFALVMNFVSYWYSDKLVLAMSGARPLTHDTNRDVYHLVENLCITAGLPAPRIYMITSDAPNAFATGRNKDHAVICLTTGLIEKLDQQELEGVIAHELSHIGNRDMLLMTVAVTLAGMVALIADFFWRFNFFGGRDNDNNNRAGGIFAIIGLAALILAPIAATLIKLAISRKREYLADASGSLLTRYPEGLARALEKIGADKTPLRQAKSATAHLFIANPLKSSALMSLFSTHPPIAERVKRLRAM